MLHHHCYVLLTADIQHMHQYQRFTDTVTDELLESIDSYLLNASCCCILANKEFHQPLKSIAPKHVGT